MKDLQEEMQKAIFGPEIPQDPAWALYRELSRNNLQETMDVLYSCTRKLVPISEIGKSWRTLGEEFITQHQPRDWRINWVFEKFSEWLPAELWLKELADFEWAQFIVRSGRDSTSEDWINSNLVLRCYEYPIPQWYAWLDSEENLPVNWKPETSLQPLTLAIFRHPESFDLKTLEVQPAAYELLSQWIEGGTPETSAQLLAETLNRPSSEILTQIQPLIKIFVQEGVLLQDPRKSTRNFYA